MVAVRRKFVDGRYGQMHVRFAEAKQACAPPLILLHMLPQSSKLFEPLIALLGERRLVIAPDFPGYGESDGPEQPILPQDYAACIWETLEALGEPELRWPIDLFGIHGGAKLGVEVVLAKPEKINRVALSSLALISGHEHQNIKRAFTPTPLDHEGTRFQEIWSLILSNSGAELTLEQAANSFSEMLRPGEKYTWGNLALLDYNCQLAERLALIKHRVNLINPGDALFEQTKQTQHLLHDCTYHEREHWGLMFPWSHLDEFADLLDQIFPMPAHVDAGE